jgi:hypothetical protein
MAKTSISVGDNTPTGEPESGPKGPYITDKDDGTRPPRKGRRSEAEIPQQSAKRDAPARRKSR